MRARAIPPCPSVLDGPTSAAAAETAKAIEHYAQHAPPSKSYQYKVYRDDTVKQALNEAFGFKCAYCESSYGATQPVDVEHYRPKGEVVTRTGRTLRPGYYWLAATWDNLLPSCIDCNRARTQATDEEGSRLVGKANLFPLVDERRRVRRPGSLVNEKPLLLHPYFDQPENHLEFGPEGVVRAVEDPAEPHGECPRGRATKEVLGLNRRGLVMARAAHRRLVEVQLERVADAEADFAERSGDARCEHRLRRELDELAKLQADDVPYTLMTAQLIDAYKARRPTQCNGVAPSLPSENP